MDFPAQHSYPLDCATGRWTMIATILASSMAFIDATALNVILPSLQRDLNATGAELFWVLNSYQLMLAALIIVGGSLGDKLGRVRIFKLGILIFITGSVLCGLTPDITLLILFRTLQGMGGALMIPGSLAIISAIYNNEEKGKAIGTWSAATTIVTICGPVLGGALADIGLWRSIFFINVPLGLLSLYALQFKVPESYEPGKTPVDWKGAVLLFASLASMTLGFLEMPELGYRHWVVITGLIAGVVLLAGFILLENKIKDPMIPFSVFRNRTFSGVNLLSFFLYAALGGMMLFLSLNVIQIQGYSQLQAGLTFLPFSLIMFLLARRMGALSDRYGVRWFLIAGPALTGIGMAWLATVGLTGGPADYWHTFFPPFMVFALGMSLTVVPLTTAVMSSVAGSKSGIASGINNSVTRIAGTFINAILGAAAIFLFTEYVMADVDKLEVSQEVSVQIREETINFGESEAPVTLSEPMQAIVSHIFKTGFISTYKLVGLFCSGLAFLSSLIAFLMVKNRPA